MVLALGFRRLALASHLKPLTITPFAILGLVFIASCGGNPPGGGSAYSGPTLVTLVSTATANDQLSQFALAIESLSLTTKSGQTVPVISSEQDAEYIHVNGAIEPLATASVPQGDYTSASITVGWDQFTCLVSDSGGLASSTFSYGYTPQSHVSITLPQPLNIRGETMALSLNLLVEQSASFNTCFDPSGINSFAITPTFTLSPYVLAAQPSSASNGRISNFTGSVATLAASSASFTLSLPDLETTRTDMVSTSASTTFQGLPNFAAVATGQFLNLDANLQSDGSLAATRINVPDTSAVFYLTGPIAFVDAIVPDLSIFGRQEGGGPFVGVNEIGLLQFSFANATFLVSNQQTNLQNLPFTPVFNASTMVDGQNVFLTSPSPNWASEPDPTVTTLTLIPQFLDGTITGSSTSGAFTVYSIQLAPYDLFPEFAVQQGQTTLLNNPTQVQVYVDTNTQLLNSQPLAPGGVFRFNGLVFNDNGTLRMDCAQINDGVSVAPLPAPSGDSAKPSRVRVIRDVILPSGMHRVDRLITPAQ